MEPSATDDTPSPSADTKPVFRVAVVDALMACQDAPKASQQAVKFGLHRTHYADLRSGRKTASLATALKIAAVAKAPVEALFGRAA